jgi:DNA-binding MarR family transcriptional regulator
MAKSPDLRDHELGAWQEFLRAHSRVVRALDDELRAEEGLSLSQYEVLLWLARAPEGAMRMGELATNVILSPSGVTRAVSGLERRGLVERRRSTSDGRGYLAALTPEGRSRLRRAAHVHVRGIKEHFVGRLSAARLKEFRTTLCAIAASELPERAPLNRPAR